MKQGDTGTAPPGLTVDEVGVGTAREFESPVSGWICDSGEGGAGFRIRVDEVVERGKYGLDGDSLFWSIFGFCDWDIA
jgi:hypothetical protein